MGADSHLQSLQPELPVREWQTLPWAQASAWECSLLGGLLGAVAGGQISFLGGLGGMVGGFLAAGIISFVLFSIFGQDASHGDLPETLEQLLPRVKLGMMLGVAVLHSLVAAAAYKWRFPYAPYVMDRWPGKMEAGLPALCIGAGMIGAALIARRHRLHAGSLQLFKSVRTLYFAGAATVFAINCGLVIYRGWALQGSGLPLWESMDFDRIFATMGNTAAAVALATYWGGTLAVRGLPLAQWSRITPTAIRGCVMGTVGAFVLAVPVTLFQMWWFMRQMGIIQPFAPIYVASWWEFLESFAHTLTGWILPTMMAIGIGWQCLVWVWKERTRFE